NVTVTVTGNPLTQPTTSSVTVMGFNPMTTVVPQGNCAMSCMGTCVCLGVDLKDAPLAGLRGTVRVTVPAGAFVDAVGNASMEQTADLQVTRVKWVRAQTRPTGSTFVAAPAVDALGNLYVGASNNTDNLGVLVSLRASDGATRWQTVDAGAVQALAAATSTIATPPMTQADVVYVTSNEDNAGTKSGRLRGLRADTGTTSGLSGSTCYDGIRPMYSAPALVIVGAGSAGNAPQVAALGLFNTAVVDGNACGYSPSTGNSNATSPASATYSLPAVPAPAESVVNLVSNGTAHFSINNDFSVEQWSWAMSTALASTGTLGRGGVGPTQTGLAFAASTLVTTQTQSGTPREPLGLVGRMLMNATYSTATGGFAKAGPAIVLPGVGANNFLLVSGATDGSNGSWLRQQAIAAADTTAPTFTGAPGIPAMLPTRSESLPTSPVYGDANQVYLVTRAGRLYVLDATPSGLSYAWDAVLPSLTGEVLAHPTLDCNRGRGTTAPGVLYTVSSQGTVAAVVVDSRRLGASPWPKWQRTAGNAGNTSPVPTDFPLNPGCN
ncbi:MAG: hypothetical protein Q8L14_16415, partial [Myxococcales bacterium]|nr:hypothetical protein [Myxococcales bacterium]